MDEKTRREFGNSATAVAPIKFEGKTIDELVNVRENQLESWLTDLPVDTHDTIVAYVDKLIAKATGDDDT